MLFHDIVLCDEESNTFISVIEHCYKSCYIDGEVPDYFILYDTILEFVTDNMVRVVTYHGIRMSAIQALDMHLKQVLFDEGFVFKFEKEVVNAYQLIMFEDLYDSGGFIE